MSLDEQTRLSLSRHVELWMNIALSTRVADRNVTERAVRDAYRIVGLPQPTRYVWLDSPMAGAIAAAHISTAVSNVNERVARRPQEFMMKKLWQKAEVMNQTLHWEQIQLQLSRGSLTALRNNVVLPIARQIANQQVDRAEQARLSLFAGSRTKGANISPEVWNNAVAAVKEELTKEELKNMDNCVTWARISKQLTACSFGNMDGAFFAFLDYANIAGMSLNDMQGIVEIAQSAGWWWPFMDLCILTERPKSLSINRQVLLHKENGPAVEFRDGWSVFAMNGNIVSREIADSAVQVVVD